MALKFKATVVENIDCSQLILGKSIVERLEIYSESEEYIILRIYSEPDFMYEYLEKIHIKPGTTIFENLNMNFNESIYDYKEFKINIEISKVDCPENIIELKNFNVHINSYEDDIEYKDNENTLYDTLNNTLDNTDNIILEHNIVKNIIDESVNWEEDNKYNIYKVYPFKSDSSQSEVVESAFKNQITVVKGGKSMGKINVISNIVGTAVEKGQKVLFISENKSNISDFKNTVECIGGNNFTIELKDDETFFNDFIENIEHIFNILDNCESYCYENVGNEKRYNDTIEKIKQYYDVMTKKGQCGKSLEELYQMYENYSDNVFDIKCNIDSSVDIEEGTDIIEGFSQILKICGVNDTRYMKYIRYNDMNIDDRKEAFNVVKEVIFECEKLISAVKEFEKYIGLNDTVSDKEAIKRTILYASLILKCPVIGDDFDFEDIKNPKEDSIKNRMTTLVDIISRKKSMKLSSKNAEKELEQYLKEGVGTDRANSILENDTSDEIKEEISKISMKSFIMGGRKSEYAEKKEKYYSFLNLMNDKIEKRPENEKICIKDVINNIIRGKDTDIINKSVEIIDIYKKYNRIQSVAEKMVLSNIDDFEKDYPKELRLVLFKEFEKIYNNGEGLEIYQNFKEQGKNCGLYDFMVQIENEIKKGTIYFDDIVDIFRKCWCSSNIKNIQNEFSDLKNFNFIDYQMQINRYRKEEERLRKDIKNNIIKVYIENIKNVFNENRVEFTNLQKFIHRNKDRSIESIFNSMPSIIREIYPCMIMSSDFVSKYIPLGFDKFDVVIIDEGFNLSVDKSLIPIFYGKRCLIFGDDTFKFDTYFESIFERAIIMNVPKKTLKYDYENIVENTLDLSNKEFCYNNENVFKNNSMIDNIAKYLIKEGFDVNTNIGKGKFKIDIGIVSNNRDKYSLGIIVDDFKEFKNNIGDREIIYPDVLKNKGWNIYRLYSVNWHTNSQREIDNIKNIVAQIEGV